MLGRKFRRQHVLHGFIADFYCGELKLVLELDGAPHTEPAQAKYDDARTAWLQARGYRVLRLSNRDVSREGLERVLRPFLRPPSPDRERGSGGEVPPRAGAGVGKGQCVPPLPVGRGGQGGEVPDGPKTQLLLDASVRFLTPHRPPLYPPHLPKGRLWKIGWLACSSASRMRLGMGSSPGIAA